MAKKKKSKKTSPINWIQIAVELITGLVTGIILMIIERLIK